MAFDPDCDSDGYILFVIKADDSTVALDIYGFAQRYIGRQLQHKFNAHPSLCV